MKLNHKIRILFTNKELKKAVFIFIGIIFLGIFEVIGVSAVVPFIAVVLSPEIVFENDYFIMIYNFLNLQSVESFIIFLGLVLISTIVISNFYQAFMNWATVYFTNKIGYRLSVRLLEKYLNRNYDFFLNRNTSDLTKNIISEVQRVTSGVVMQSITILSKLVIIINLLAVLIYVNPLIAALSTLIMGGAYALIFLFFKSKLQAKGTELTEYDFKAYKAINESMSGIKDIKLHSNESEFIKRYAFFAKKMAIIQAHRVLITSMPRYLLEAIAFAGMVIIIIVLISLNDGMNSAIFPVVGLYAMVGYRLMPAFQQMYSGIANLKFNLPAFENLVKEFNYSDSLKQELNEAKIVPFRDKIKISKLYFSYESDENNILNDLNLEILKNTTVGLVGSTGSGKTTLIDIILFLLQPSSGCISIDGIEINSKNRLGWQKQIGYVPQSIYLTDDSILENIAFAVPFDEIDLKKVEKAAKMASLHNFVQTLPAKYDTLVGERGVRLSGGQRQRIGIARALYHDPDVLVLDEATSSLDGITEDVIIEAIKNLSHKKTIIMIAHRISTVKDCDTIYLLKNGNVKESGSYEYLIKNSDEFRKIAKKL